MLLVKANPVIAYDSRQKKLVILFPLIIMYNKLLRKFYICNRTKLIIILTFHAYIKVVIPWHKATMPYCSEEASPVCKIIYIMFSADTVDFIKHNKTGSPSLLDGCRNIKSISDFISEKINRKIHNPPFLM